MNKGVPQLGTTNRSLGGGVTNRANSTRAVSGNDARTQLQKKLGTTLPATNKVISQKGLPQTSEKNEPWLVLLGGMLLSLVFIFRNKNK
ncbi:hypothetical protein CBF31_04760 [Vagococcus fessus]|uniref:Gram-positive cocci surface proteins LPxTG domain-containing protein n=1 Tax=Vagococcus fessus TaxID=120370 RepID=A0A430A9G5_9ENTE|nr:hypothetical protein CBF31_04760 [Vagococcus fessus]